MAMISMTILGPRMEDWEGEEWSREGDAAAPPTGWTTLSFTCVFSSCRTPFRKDPLPLLNRVPKKHRLDLEEVAPSHFELIASFEGSGNEETERDIIG
jgi:hypothetical protein